MSFSGSICDVSPCRTCAPLHSHALFFQLNSHPFSSAARLQRRAELLEPQSQAIRIRLVFRARWQTHGSTH